jgi:hypothetical protein
LDDDARRPCRCIARELWGVEGFGDDGHGASLMSSWRFRASRCGC